MFISKGNYGYGEPKNVNDESVKKAHLPLRACKVPSFTYRRILSLMKFWDNSGLHHGNVFTPKQCLHEKEATGMDSLKM